MPKARSDGNTGQHTCRITVKIVPIQNRCFKYGTKPFERPAWSLGCVTDSYSHIYCTPRPSYSKSPPASLHSQYPSLFTANIMQPMFTVHQPAAVPQAHIPTTHRSFVAPMMPSQPDSEAYGCDTPCVVPGVTMPQEECFVGDISTLLPAFGTSLTGTPLPHYAHQAPVPQPYVVAASPPFDAGPSSFTPASDEPRRLSHPARSGLSVQSPIAHPYARLWNKKARSGRRKKWTHALEKLLFTSREM